MIKDECLLYIENAIQNYHQYVVVNTLLLTSMDTKLLQLIILNISDYSNVKYHLPIRYKYLWNYDIIMFEDDNMKKIFNIQIPYGTRENYYDMIFEMNQIVSKSESIILFVNNNPYCLDSVLYVETANMDELLQIVNKYKAKLLNYGKYLNEYISQMGDRGWCSIGIPYHILKGDLMTMIEDMYQISTISELEKNGYKFPKDKRKIFVSYSHKDKGIVLPFVDELKNLGLSLWIDKLEIDYGENITEKIQKAMKDSDIVLTFLSMNTLNALYAKHELLTTFNDIVYQKKKFIPIKLDDVDLNEIVYGLNNYLYVDFQDDKEVKKLISRLIFEFRG